MQYLIDGYNLLFLYLTPDKNLQNKREELISILNDKLKEQNIEAKLIFDGFSPINHAPTRDYFEALDVIYSPNELSADEYILELISTSKNPKDFIVVTADKGLANSARTLGAQTKSPKSFLKQISEKKTSSYEEQKAAEDTKKNIERLLKIFERRIMENDLDY